MPSPIGSLRTGAGVLRFAARAQISVTSLDLSTPALPIVAGKAVNPDGAAGGATVTFAKVVGGVRTPLGSATTASDGSFSGTVPGFPQSPADLEVAVTFSATVKATVTINIGSGFLVFPNGNVGDQIISGTVAIPLSTIPVYLNGSQIGTTYADSTGFWSFPLSTPLRAGDVITYFALLGSTPYTVNVVPPAPTTVTISTTTVDQFAYVGARVAVIVADQPGAVSALTDDAGGMFTLSGTALRLEKPLGPVGTQYSYAGTMTTAGGSKAFSGTLTVIAGQHSPLLFARFDTLDSSKLNVAGGKVTAWTDSINGFTLSETNTSAQPLLDTTNTAPGGAPAVSFVDTSLTGLSATLGANGGLNDPLISLVNQFGSTVSVLFLMAVPTLVAGNRAIACWGTTDTTQIGGARNYLMHQVGGNGSGISVAVADQTASNTLGGAGSTNTSLQAIGHRMTYVGGNSLAGAGDINFTYTAKAVANSGIQTKVSNTFSLGRRIAGNTGGTSLKARVYAILIYNGTLSRADMTKEMRLLGAEFGTDLGYVPPARIDPTDTSTWQPTFVDDFVTPQIYEPNILNDHGTMSRPWVPHYVGYNSAWGSPGAIAGELAGFIDPRIPAMGPYNPFTVADSKLKISAVPRPSALASIPMKNINGTDITYISGAMVTMASQGGFSQQYGYYEFRLRGPAGVIGNFPAAWMMSASNRWPTEIDIYEMFGQFNNDVIQPALHSDPYWPIGTGDGKGTSGDSPIGVAPAGAVDSPGNVQVADIHTNYHVLGVDFQPGWIRFYFDREYVGEMSPQRGVVSVTINNGGTNVVADNGTANGVIVVNGPGNARGVFAVSGGVITGYTAYKVGASITSPPATDDWKRIATGYTSVLLSSYGVSLTTQYGSNDPVVPLQYHTPFYILLDMGMGDFTGTPTAPATYEIDYVKVWRRKFATPSIATGTQPDAQAIFDRMSVLGSAPSSTRQTAINDFVRQAKAWQLRFDTVPMSAHTSDWDVTKLSLWDAIEGLYFLAADSETQALVNWKAPSSGDLTKFGTPTFTGKGYAFTGTKGQYLDTGKVPSTGFVNYYDNHIAYFSRSMSPPGFNSTPFLGCSTLFFQQVIFDGTVRAALHDSGPGSGVMKPPAVPKGYVINCRGWRYQRHDFLNGRFYRGTYSVPTNANPTTNFLIGTNNAANAGPACELSAAHWGRRLMPDEAEVLNGLVAAYLATLGVTP